MVGSRRRRDEKDMEKGSCIVRVRVGVCPHCMIISCSIYDETQANEDLLTIH